MPCKPLAPAVGTWRGVRRGYAARGELRRAEKAGRWRFTFGSTLPLRDRTAARRSAASTARQSPRTLHQQASAATLSLLPQSPPRRRHTRRRCPPRCRIHRFVLLLTLSLSTETSFPSSTPSRLLRCRTRGSRRNRYRRRHRLCDSELCTRRELESRCHRLLLWLLRPPGHLLLSPHSFAVQHPVPVRGEAKLFPELLVPGGASLAHPGRRSHSAGLCLGGSVAGTP